MNELITIHKDDRYPVDGRELHDGLIKEQMLNDATYVYAKQLLGVLQNREFITDEEEEKLSTLVSDKYPSSMLNLYSGRAYLSCQGYGELCKSKHISASNIRKANHLCEEIA